MKFKVGDKVKVIQNSDSETQERYSSWVGKTYTITELDKDYFYPYKINGKWWGEQDLELIKPQHTLYNWRNYITFDIEVLQEKIDTSNSEMYRGFSEEEYEKIEEHDGTVEELLIWLSKGYVLLEAFAKEE